MILHTGLAEPFLKYATSFGCTFKKGAVLAAPFLKVLFIVLLYFSQKYNFSQKCGAYIPNWLKSARTGCGKY